MHVNYITVKNDPDIRTFIAQADASLLAMGYTDHSFAHVVKCAEVASTLLRDLDYDVREQDLAKIAGFMHDIGNVVNRNDHAQSGALIAYRLLDKLGMDSADLAKVITAIGYHDDKTAHPVSAISAALLLADKTDVRRSRVRNKDTISFDIHDRVNYAVERSETALDRAAGTLTLKLEINTQVCAVMDYFEIFLERMHLCRKAAEFFGLTFKLDINGSILL